MVTLVPPSLRGVPPPPSCPLLPLLLRPTSLALSRSELRLHLAGDAAPASARGSGALEELAGAVEVAVEAVEGVGVVVGVVAGVGLAVAAVEAEEAAVVAVGAEEAEVAEAAKVAAAAVELVAALRRGVAPVVVSASSSSALVRPRPPSSFVSGTLGVSGCGGSHCTQRCFGRLTDAWRHQFPDATEIPRWGELSRAGVAIFDLDYDAILAAMYAVSTSDEGECYLCVPPGLGIGTAALGAVEAAALGASESAAPGAGLYLPSFSTNLVSGADQHDGGVHQFTPRSQRVTHFTCAQTGRHLATFTCRPGSSLYTLTTGPPQATASGQVAASGQASAAASRACPYLRSLRL
ncbi:unnamed protein product [Closterium sp. NIES-65]|nr:unnamed protein product [Closterium sp. NIES-65]